MSEHKELHNIGEDGRRLRLFFGILLSLFSLGFIALVTVTSSPLALRVVVFLPTWLGVLALLEAREST